MYYLVYTSAAVDKLAEEDLSFLLRQYLGKTKFYNITGLLLYIDGNFFQVLEGEKEDVLNFFFTIEKDSRHNKIITLMKGELEARNFKNWKMGFKASENKAYPNFVNLNNNGLVFVDNSKQNHPAALLINYFYSRLNHYSFLL